MTSKIRVAVVGLGSMGRNHLRVLAAMPDVEVVALCDSEPERVPSGPWQILTDYRSVVYESPDYCVIATPTLTHSEVALHLIKQGLPLLVEKPLARTADEAREILEASRDGNRKVAVGMIERFNRAALEAKNLVESQKFGKLLKFSTRRVGPPPGRDMGVGVLLDLGIHDLDLVRWITTEQLVTAHLNFVAGIASPHDDLALVSGELPSGALWHSEVSWLSPTKERVLDLSFVSARISLNLLTGEVAIVQQSGEETEWEAIREFRGPTSVSSVVYGVKTVEPLLSMHRTLVAAVKSGDWSKLPSVKESVEILNLIETLYSGRFTT